MRDALSGTAAGTGQVLQSRGGGLLGGAASSARRASGGAAADPLEDRLADRSARSRSILVRDHDNDAAGLAVNRVGHGLAFDQDFALVGRVDRLDVLRLL